MKKKIFYLLLCVLMCLTLVGCGDDDKDTEKSSKKDKTEEKVSKTTIVFGEEKEFKNFTITLSEAYLTDDIIPQKATSYYSHYEAKSGELYLDIIMKVKNTANKSVDIDDLFDGKVKVGSKEYTGMVFMEEDGRSDFTGYGYIDSLATEYVHFAVAVPENTSTSDKITVELTIDEKTYTADASNAVEKTKKVIEDSTKTIANNEKQTIDKVAEFYIEKSSITKKVEPPKASSYYTYYEADSGKVYVDIVISYKNLNSIDAECDELLGGAKLIYDNNYEYTGNAIVEEDNRSDFTYASITSISPLTTEYVHYLFQIPENLKDETGSLVFQFRIGDNLYKYSVR